MPTGRKRTDGLYPERSLRRLGSDTSPPPDQARFCVKFKKGETVIYPQHGACVVQGTKKMEFFGE